MLKLSFLTSSNLHKVYPEILSWAKTLRQYGHHVDVHTRSDTLTGGDLLFLISCSEILGETIRSQYTKCLVLHASELPFGRGWSPHIWAILSGEDKITVSMIEASDLVDSGDIVYQTSFKLIGNELLTEINSKLFHAEYELILRCVEHAEHLPSRKQPDSLGSYCNKRSIADSELDIEKSIKEQFNLLRVVDNENYPAFFRHLGSKYVLKIERFEDEQS